MEQAIRSTIDAAIERGVPAYNAGDAIGCFKIYSTVATSLVSSVDDKAIAELLKAGLQHAQQFRTADSQAWAMRDTLDRCCVCVAIRGGISKGAPLFNDGRQRQCFELYANVAKDCLRVGSVPPPGLEEALMQAQSCGDDCDAAWTMRDAFDAILAKWIPQETPPGRGGASIRQTPSTSEAFESSLGSNRSNGSGSRVLLSRGERVALLSGDGTTWVPISDALLDTGNEARTLIAPRVARMLGLVAQDSAPPLAVRGVNGVTSMYPRTAFKLRIGDVETGVLMGAIGGDTAVLVGRDVLGPLGEMGYSVRQM